MVLKVQRPGHNVTITYGGSWKIEWEIEILEFNCVLYINEEVIQNSSFSNKIVVLKPS